MAQLSGALKSSSSFQTPPSTSTYKSPQTEASPKVDELLQADGTIKQPSLGSGKHNDYDNRKPSVLNKMRDKAKKLKSTLSSKRIRQSNTDSEYDHGKGNKTETDTEDEPDDKTIHSLDVNLDEDEIDEDPEYLGAPIYESVQAPQECKENVKQHPREVTASAEKHIIESCAKSAERKSQEPIRKTMTETVSEKLVPAAYNVVSSATQAITAKISSLTVETPGSGDSSSESRGQTQNSNLHMYDKGVSVKEYLMQKLEPGEDEKLLSQVISDAISPKGTEQVGIVVEKMKEAVNSFLQDAATKAAESTAGTNASTDPKSSSNKSFAPSKTFTATPDPAQKTSAQNAIAADSISHPLSDSSSNANKMKSKSCNATSNLKLSSFIPISTNSEEGTNAENHGKILQTN